MYHVQLQHLTNNDLPLIRRILLEGTKTCSRKLTEMGQLEEIVKEMVLLCSLSLVILVNISKLHLDSGMLTLSLSLFLFPEN